MSRVEIGGGGIMLKKFEFTNSYSYQGKVKLDMSAKLTDKLDDKGLPLPEKSELHEVVRKRISGNKYGILPVAAIYGKNAGGKTKLLSTLRDAALDALGESFSSATAYSDMSPYEQIIKQRQFIVLSKNKRKQNLSYSICVVLENTEYTLDYTIARDGIIKERVTVKNLLGNNESKPIYSKNGSKLSKGENEHINRFIKLLYESNPKVFLFPLIVTMDADIKKFYEWFRYVRDGINFNDGNNQNEKFENIATRIVNGKDEPFRTRLLHFLKCLDDSIVNIEGQEYNGKYRLWIYHRKADDKEDSFAPFIEKESAGTRKLLEQFPMIDRCLKNGMPFICDEFDRMLHPVAFKQLVRMFNDPEVNIRNAQLIFTAHDTIPLDSSFLRRDEVHIVDKSDSSISTIKRLSEMEHVELYSNMEREFRTNYYGSFPEEFNNCYGEPNEQNTNA
jgi:AAA15 family ATPase/GTPase